jgi:DNA repair protein RecO
MSYIIHQTEGLILDEIHSSESSKMLFVLTPSFGILPIFAQGVREIKSKMRGSLSVGSLSSFEFIEGREMKKLIGVSQKKFYSNIFLNSDKANVYFRCITFLKRVLLGEIESEKLYTRILQGFSFLENIETQDFEIIEMIIIMNILFHLGYWEDDNLIEYNQENLNEISKQKTFFLNKINSAIKNTHL